MLKSYLCLHQTRLEALSQRDLTSATEQQGRRDATSIVAYEVLITNRKRYYRFFQLQLFHVKFLSYKILQKTYLPEIEENSHYGHMPIV